VSSRSRLKTFKGCRIIRTIIFHLKCDFLKEGLDDPNQSRQLIDASDPILRIFEHWLTSYLLSFSYSATSGNDVTNKHGGWVGVDVYVCNNRTAVDKLFLWKTTVLRQRRRYISDCDLFQQNGLRDVKRVASGVL